MFVDGIWWVNLFDEEVEFIKKSFENCISFFGFGLGKIFIFMICCFFLGKDFDFYGSLVIVVD